MSFKPIKRNSLEGNVKVTASDLAKADSLVNGNSFDSKRVCGKRSGVTWCMGIYC